MSNTLLVGTWKLHAWQITSSEGQVTYPFGQDPIGYIQYTADGFMSVSIMRAHRTNFAGADLLGGSAAEKAAAAEGYLSYCGTYHYDGVQVTHHIQVSLFPNWVGIDQLRLVELTADGFILRSRPMVLQGKEQVAQLDWRRIPPG